MLDPDVYLTHLARLVEKAHADGKTMPKISVSLVTGGLVVEGSVISSEEFFQSSHRILNGLAQLRAEATATVAFEFELTLKTVDELTAQPFLHLADVRFWSPGADTHGPSEVGCWRVRISSIDGFSFHEDLFPDA